MRCMAVSAAGYSSMDRSSHNAVACPPITATRISWRFGNVDRPVWRIPPGWINQVGVRRRSRRRRCTSDVAGVRWRGVRGARSGSDRQDGCGEHEVMGASRRNRRACAGRGVWRRAGIVRPAADVEIESCLTRWVWHLRTFAGEPSCCSIPSGLESIQWTVGARHGFPSWTMCQSALNAWPQHLILWLLHERESRSNHATNQVP